MIDLAAEIPIPLAAAAKLIPPGRGGKKTHLSTVLRWILDGAPGPGGARIRLEALRLGGRWMTTREALQRFAERLTPRLDGDATTTSRTPGRRQRASDKATRELEKIGI